MVPFNAAVPSNVRQNFARARSFLLRNETIKALEALLAGLESYDRAKLPAKARFETEVLILEVAADISRQPLVRTFFDKIAGAGQAGVSYRPGEEEKFLKTMRILLKGLKNMEEEKRRRERQTLDNRRESLQEKGLAYLKAGDAPRGKSALRVLADEFGHEPGVLASIGGWLQEAGLFLDAVEFLEQAIRDFPKDSSAYGHAAAVYSSLSEFEKAEAVYLKALKEFGKHPRTMLNLAKLYLNWNKKDKAYDAAREACRGDPSLDEARAIMASCS